MRVASLVAALSFNAILAALTVAAVIGGGVNILTLVTLLVLALLSVAIVAAIRGSPPS